jgi:hypothetical protein
MHKVLKWKKGNDAAVAELTSLISVTNLKFCVISGCDTFRQARTLTKCHQHLIEWISIQVRNTSVETINQAAIN